jgi:hypothetical protein
MENKLTLSHLLHCYNTIKHDREIISDVVTYAHLGYLEAGLVSFGALETEQRGNISIVKREMVKNTKWWKKDRDEDYEEAIIRQIEKLFTDNQIKF